MFQNFDPPGERVVGDTRLAALRVQMVAEGVDAIIVPHGDEQRNEYLPPHNERLRWLTGFSGSAGAAVVTAEAAVLFVDGRYTLQAAEQVDDAHWTVDDLVSNPPAKWLGTAMGPGGVIGIDPWLHGEQEVEALRKSAGRIGAQVKLLEDNLVDRIWHDRPPPPVGPVEIQHHSRAGRLTIDKLAAADASLADAKADMCVLSDATSVSWLFNIRGADVVHTPLVLAHAILRRGQEPLLFVDDRKLDIEVRAFLTQVCALCQPETLVERLRELAEGRRVMLDPGHSPFAMFEIVDQAGGTIVRADDPVRLPKAIKNEAEIAGSRAAHLRDGVAMAHFLAWLDGQAPGSVDEIGAARQLEAFRSELAGNEPLRDLSFDTISGAGPNGAIVHYRVTQETNRKLREGELYLVDSGAQYGDGTTDITRTVAIGEPGADERRCYTLVLKGHIALALARFPEGTWGVDLDPIARMPLWQAGLDYAHGTGHGIGSYLAVHEGPQSISKRGMAVLEPGMILSNEPGYYRQGAFGIRLENLVLVKDAEPLEGGDTPMMGFETLTFTPFDRRLIVPNLLDEKERNWLNEYHRMVRDKLAPRLAGGELAWLEAATEAL